MVRDDEKSFGAVLVYEDPLTSQLNGCVVVELDRAARRASFGMVAVPALYGGRGVGSALVEAAEARLRAELRGAPDSGADAGEIVICVVSLREDLHGFYRRRGYRMGGTLPFTPFFHDRQADGFNASFVEMRKTAFME